LTKEEYIQHTAVLREAQLAAGLLGSGVTKLGKATHETVGRYHEAFFGLSIGIERLCKLIYIADYAINHDGSFPNYETLIKQNHKLGKLLNICEGISGRINSDRNYSDRPSTDIHKGIIQVLNDFAMSTRYYNLDYLAGRKIGRIDPVAAWWTKVGEPICKLHYNTKSKQRDEAEAAMMGSILNQFAMVVHTAETGEPIKDVSELMKRRGANVVVQKYGRLYVLQIVRWLASIARELSMIGGYKKQIAALFCFHEPLVMFNNDDKFLRDRKTWDFYNL